MAAPRMVRWIAPAAAVALAAGLGSGALTASADPALEARTAEQLLVDVQQARPQPLSGVVQTTVNLGLPAMPTMPGGHGATLDAMSTLMGSTTFRVWFGDHNQQRVTWVASRAEASIIRNASDVWLWDSTKQTAHHIIMPALDAHPTKPVDKPLPGPSGKPSTPAEAAQMLLEAMEPSTAASVDKQVNVAGRAAYELVLTPKNEGTRVKAVRIAIDGETKLPLRVQVMSTRLSEAAISIGFTSISYGKPADSVFGFNPGPGVDVTTTDVSKGTHEDVLKAIEKARAEKGKKKDDGAQTPTPLPKPTVSSDPPVITGAGWASIASGKVNGLFDMLTRPAQGDESGLGSIIGLLPTRTGAFGTARILDGTLVSLVVTTDGRYAVGAVDPDRLLAALPAA